MKITKEWLFDQYHNKKLSTHEIAKLARFKSHSSILNYMNKYNIPRFPPSLRRKRTRDGKNKGLWKGIGEISGSFVYIAKANAKIRGIPFKINAKYLNRLWIKQKGICALSGIKIQVAYNETTNGRLNKTASLDRIDSSKGYIKGNVQFVHKTAQRMKMDMSQLEFIKWCQDIGRYNDCNILTK